MKFEKQNLDPFDRTWKRLVPAGLLALFLLFYLHPYYGIRHDAALYLGQALLRLDPENFRNDLFFAYGSQASYTIFPTLIAQLLVHFDAASVFMALTAVGLVFFLVASAGMLVRIFPAPQWYWGLLALLVLPSGYGGYGVFSYAETFFTGRSIAEPLALLAVALYLCECRLLAGVLWLASAVLHPLQALPLLMVWWCDRVHQNRRWLHLLWLPVLVFFAAAFGFSPFAQWTARYDAEWLTWIQEPNRHVFITLWEFKSWTFLATDLFLVAMLFLNSTGVLKSLSRALLAATGLGFVCSLLLVDGLHLVLPTGLQLWRVQWLLHWLAMAGVPFLIYLQYQKGGVYAVRLWLLMAIVVLGAPSLVTGSTSLAVWILAPLYLGWPWLEHRIGPSTQRLMLAAVPVVFGILLIKHGFHIYAQSSQADGLRDVVRPEFVLLAHPLVAGALLGLLLWVFRRSAHWRVALTCLLIPALLLAAVQWDRRSTWTRYIEFAHYDPQLFGFKLEPGAQVFWSGELIAPWLILHRPSYFNGHQEAGMLFNRGTAAEAVQRDKTMRLVEFQLSICGVMNGLNQSAKSCWLDAEAVADACRKAAGKLDYLVLDNTLTVPAAGSWKIMGGLKGDRPITYNLYRCRDFASLSSQ